jgi:hypothetical protein
MGIVTTSVRHVSRRNASTLCPLSGQTVTPPPNSWAVFYGDAVLGDAAAREHAPELYQLAKAMAPAEPSEGERHSFGIIRRSPGAKVCPHTGEFFTPREFDVAGVSATETGRWLSVEGGEDLAPRLAAALHSQFDTSRAERVAPPDQPAETAEERAGREQAEGERRRGKAMHEIARVLDARGYADGPSLGRAASLVEALRTVLG